jgi:hypothetical protein
LPLPPLAIAGEAIKPIAMMATTADLIMSVFILFLL